MYNDWKFTRCSSCRKKASFVNNQYYCNICDKVIANPLQAYKLVIEVVDGDYEMSFVLFDDYAKSLIGITVDELLTKSFCEGADDPDWIYNFLVDILYGRRVLLSIKVDKFNLSPKFVRRFTVVKYFDVNDTVSSEETTSASTSTVPVLPTESDDYCELEPEEEMLSNITDFEWDMTAKAIWGESSGSQSPNKSTSEVPCANDDVEQSVNSTIETDGNDV